MPTLILTLANKPTLLIDALASVAAQRRRDFQHVVELDSGKHWPAASYPPAVFFNRVVAERARPDDNLAWLSDDDVWEPTFLRTLAGFLDDNPDVGACYGGSRLYTYDGKSERHVRDLPAEVIYGATRMPSCQIDGGQILVRRSVLNRIAYPWVPEGLNDCNIADGSFMNRIAEVTPIIPVEGSWVMRNRQTPQSSHWAFRDGVPTYVSDETRRRLMGGR